MEPTDYIYGIRAVIEAIREGRSIDKLFIKKDLSGDLASELFGLMREHRMGEPFPLLRRSKNRFGQRIRRER